LRQAGATARTVLVSAAAKRWNVDPASCRAQSGEVLHAPTGRRIKYGELAADAARMPVPERVTLKRPEDFKLIGTPAKRVDTPAKVNGTAIYGIDVRPPGVKIATLAQSPVFGGRVKNLDDTAAKAVKGVRQIVRLHDAVAVVADHMGAAEPPGIPTAFWRSVGPSHNVFVTESFMDELAFTAKQDPVAYRLALLDKTPRAKAVLALAAEKAGWGQPLPERVGRGVSLQFVFATYMAQVAEVEVSKDGAVRVRRVVCAVDCGTVVNPDTVRAQIQSGIIFGATAALYGEITLKDGRVEQTNFDTYQMLRMSEAPAIEVHIVKSAEPPGGMGETGTSAIVPAIANAIFAATGKRLRKMPVDASALKQPG
jgi:CO/xanthine dehydrogenase Mo-binding subunit